DKTGEARALRVIALAKVHSGNSEGALADASAALDIVESGRSKVASIEMRTSYHVLTRDYYDLVVSILGTSDNLHPDNNFSGRALEVSEKARARGLFDLLTEARIDVGGDVETTFLQRDRSLQQQLNAREQYRMKLLAEGAPADRIKDIEREVALVADEYQ